MYINALFLQVTKSSTMDVSKGTSQNGKTHLTQPTKKLHQAIVWRNVILFTYLHLAALYGVLLIFTSAKIVTTLFGIFCYEFIKLI